MASIQEQLSVSPSNSQRRVSLRVSNKFWVSFFFFHEQQKPWVVLTSQSLCQREGVHRGPVVRGVLGLLSCLLMEVVHGTQWIHGVEGVTVHSIVLHGDINLKNSNRRRRVLKNVLFQCPGVSAELRVKLLHARLSSNLPTPTGSGTGIKIPPVDLKHQRHQSGFQA